MEQSQDYLQDLWWVPSDIPLEALSVGVGHSPPALGEAPVPVLWQSLLPNGAPSPDQALYDLSFLAEWHRRWQDTNVFRTLTLYDAVDEEPVLFGPLCVDVDAGRGAAGTYDLDDAALVARAVVQHLANLGVGEDDMRIFFTGRKGFNIEARPEALGLECRPTVATLSGYRGFIDELIATLRATHRVVGIAGNAVTPNGSVVDHFVSEGPRYALRHAHLRLANSRNAWIDTQRRERARLKTAVTIDDLFAEPLEATVQRAERGAALR